MMAVPWWIQVGRGLRLLCPECGRGGLFQGWELQTHCPQCGHEHLPGEGEFTGALMLGQGLFLLVALTGFTLLVFDHDAKVAFTWLIVWSVVAPILLYRNVKGAWVGLLAATGAHRHKATDTAPEWQPPIEDEEERPRYGLGRLR